MSLIAILFIIILTIIVIFLLAMHIGFRAPRTRETKTPQDFGMAYQQVLIPTASNKKLFAWFLPVEKASSTVIILHGWGGNAEWMLPIAQPFYRAGFNVLLFDSRCHGNSDGAMFSSLPRFAEDLGFVADWLKQHYPQCCSQLVFLGHSVGAGAVLLEASRREDIDAVISISAFAHPEWMMKRFLAGFKIPKILSRIILSYVQWLIGLRFTTFAPVVTVCDIDAPVLIVHGKADTIVPIEDAHAIMEHCPKPHLSLFEVADAGHESVDKFEEHSDVLVAFLKKSGVATSEVSKNSLCNS